MKLLIARRSRYIAGAVLVVVIGLAAAVFARMRSDDLQTRDTTRSVQSVARTTDTAAGQSGGVVQTSGRFAAEILLSEKPGDARLVVYPFFEGKLATQNVGVSGSLQRHDGTREALRFTASGLGFTSAQPIAKPHVFDAVIDVSIAGQSASFRFSRADGAIPLSVAQMQANGIEVARAGPAQIVNAVRLPGEIKLNEDRTAHVVPRVAGVIERVAVSIGQNVAQGQLLAIVASPDLADRRSEWLAAQRRLEAARTAYRREKTLWQEQISAEQDYLQAQTQLREAEIAAQNAGQKLAALNAPATASALNRYELRAPFAGTIVAKHVAPGESVAADANLFTLSDLSSVWAEMAVPAQRLNDVRVGRHATVSASAFESTAQGPIAFVGALLGEQTRTAPARVVLPNPGGTWRPGLFVEVTVAAGAQDVPVAVSAESLYDIDGAPAVFVLSKQGFIAQPVKTGKRDTQSVEIVAGLQAGQRYAAQNAYVLKAELEKGSADEH